MNWWNRLFWKVILKTDDYNTFSRTKDSTIATLTFRSNFHSIEHRFSLNEADYMEYINDVNMGEAKYFKQLKKHHDI